MALKTIFNTVVSEKWALISPNLISKRISIWYQNILYAEMVKFHKNL